MAEKLKAGALLAEIQKHVGDGYVYGTIGQTCTVELLKAKEKQYGGAMGAGYYQKNGDYTKGKCARWLGRWVCDCSGLIKSARKALSGVWRDVSAQGTYDQCPASARGAIGTMPKVPGCTVYLWSAAKQRMGHVGIYAGGGEVIEARGVGYGVVRTKLAGRAWTHWGLLDWLEHDLPADGGGSGGGGKPPEDDGGDHSAPQPDDRPTLRRGAKGEAVKTLQRALAAAGQDPGPADGDFGPRTEAAVRAYQRARGLTVDGVAGPKTWAALA